MFSDYFTSPENMKAFDALYKNVDGLQDAFVEYWDVTSKTLTSNPYVIGFDPLNEPYPGNTLRKPDLLLPGNFDRQRLAPMYARVFERYQKNDSESIMWFEPATFPDIVSNFGGIITEVGFEVPPGGEIGSSHHVLNDHTYCCQLNREVCASGEPSTDKTQECYDWHDKRIGTRDNDAKRLGLPLHITEFGACLTEGPCTQEIRQVTEVSDKYLAGWGYWQFKNYEDLTTSAGTASEGFYNPDGSLQAWKVKALARTYLMFTQGTPVRNTFDMESASFEAEFRADTRIGHPTQIYYSAEYYYSNGIETEVIANGQVLAGSQYSLSVTDFYVLLQITDDTLNGETIKFTLTKSQ